LSRLWTGTTGQYLQTSFLPGDVSARTFNAKAVFADVSPPPTQMLISYGQNSNQVPEFRSQVTTGQVELEDRSNNVGATDPSDSSDGSFHVWTAWSDKADFEIFKDGVSTDTDPENSNMTGTVNDLRIGNRSDNDALPWDGRLDYMVVWSKKLTDTQILVIARGVNPFVIEHASLEILLPIYGNEDPEPDWSGNGRNGTVNGTLVKDVNSNTELLENYV